MHRARHKSLWIGIATLAFLIAALVGVSSYFSEPRHNGRRLSHWLTEYYERHTPQSEEAVRGIGSNAVPTLLKMLLPKERKISLARLFEKTHIPIELVEDNSARFQERNLATLGFHLLGAQAASAIPVLLPLLENNDHVHFAAEALQAIGSPALPLVQQCLTGTNRRAKEQAVHIILSITRRDPPTVAAMLANPDPVIRGETYLWLSDRSDPPPERLETLIKGLDDRDPGAAALAAVALRNSGLSATNALPRLYELQQSTNAALAAEITSTIKSLEKRLRIEKSAAPPRH